MSEKKVINKDDLPDCEKIKEYMNNEENAIAEYTEEADKTDDPILKDLWNHMGEDEMKHLHKIRHLYNQKCKLK